MLISFYDIVYFLIIVLVFTLWIVFKLILNFYINKKKEIKSVHFSFRFLGFHIVPSNNFQIEFIWTVIPIVIFYFIYIPVFKLLGIFGYDDYQYNLSQEKLYEYSNLNNFLLEKDLLEDLSFSSFNKNEISKLLTSNDIIKVIGNQWYWIYEINYDCENLDFFPFDNGEFSSYMVDQTYDTIRSNFEVSSSVRLLSTDYYITLFSNKFITFFISSYDVIHSWSIPSAGIKVDACPGRIASVKTLFKEQGFFYGQCSEICGFLHGFMPINIDVISTNKGNL